MVFAAARRADAFVAKLSSVCVEQLACHGI
jgi:hypothetical protein